MIKNSWLKIILVGVLITGAIVVFSCYYFKPSSEPALNEGGLVDDISQDNTDMIKVLSPLRNTIVSGPIEIRGEARGGWYFEADFPIKLYDSAGNLLASAVASAQSDWMTEDFVPFKATIDYTLLEESDGVLVLEKDNPSGLVENHDEIRVPLRLSPRVATTSVQVFFSNTYFGSNTDCNQVYPVTRQVESTPAIGRAAIEELIKGVTEEEYAQGYRSGVNNNVSIQSLVIDQGVARIDLSSALEQNIGGSCFVAAIRSQITETLKQFPTVTGVEISIDGRTEDILQP